jgi:hypothetical protein
VLKNLKVGEITEIISLTGNHWRKIFSIFSKISYGLNSDRKKTWQEYRDEVLMTKSGTEVITFSKKITKTSSRSVHIIAGKNHCESFDLSLDKFKKIDEEGKILNYKNIYLTPYLDYRQFPNVLVETLINHIKVSDII